jgi:hypothetical protein
MNAVRLQALHKTAICLLQTENVNGKLPFACFKLETEDCFPWLANDKG